MANTYVVQSTNARLKAVQRMRVDDPTAYNAPKNKRIDAKFSIVGQGNELANVIDTESVGRRVQVKNTSGGTWAAGTLLYLGNNNLTAQTTAVAANNPIAGANVVLNVTGAWDVGMTVSIVDAGGTQYGVITATNSGAGTITVDMLFYSATTPTVTALPSYIATAADQSGQNHAEWVLPAALTNGSYGYAYDNAEVTGLNTNALTVGNLVYLSTAGAYTTTAPSTGLVQVVGVVKVKDAAVGSILFFPGNKRILSFGVGSLTAGTSGQILMSNATPAATWTTMSGNVTISSTGVTTIGSLQVTNAMLAGSIDLTTKVGTSVLPIANGGTNTNAALSNNRVMVSNGGIIAESTSTGDVTASAGVTTVAKINTVALGSTTATSGNLLIASGTQWVSTAMSGNVTINSSGATTIGALQVTNAMLAGSIDLTTKVGGSVLPIANGGTNTNASLGGGRPIVSTTTIIGESTGYAKVTTSRAITAADCQMVLDCDASGGAFTQNLPAATIGLGFRITIRKSDSTASAITIAPNGTDGIDGNNINYKLQSQYSRMVLRSTGVAGAGAGQGWIVEDAQDYLANTSALANYTTGSGTTANWTTFTFPPGEWDVTMQVMFATGTATTNNAFDFALSLNTGSFTGTVYGDTRFQIFTNTTATAAAAGTIANSKFIFTAASTSLFLVTLSTYTGTPQVAFRMSARRVR